MSDFQDCASPWSGTGMGGTPATFDYVKKIGDTMTGYLVLSGDPVLSLQAATKSYVDTQILGGPVAAHDHDGIYEPDSGGLITAHITDNTIHFIINDSSTSLQEVWSSDKVNNELNNKAELSHTHVATDITDVGDFYSKTETDVLLTGKADNIHTHNETDISDLDKYTQAEVDSLVSLKLDDAPSDGNTYGRKDGAWVIIP